jgi:peroxiredoxin
VADLKRLSKLDNAWRESSDDPAMVILGVHTAGSDAESVEKSANTHGLQYSICIDVEPSESASWGTLYGRFGVSAIPTTFVIDQDGNVAAHGPLEEMISKAGALVRSKHPKQ